jgi:hypothetical protein
MGSSAVEVVSSNWQTDYLTPNCRIMKKWAFLNTGFTDYLGLGEDAAIIETTSTFRYINWLTNMS